MEKIVSSLAAAEELTLDSRSAALVKNFAHGLVKKLAGALHAFTCDHTSAVTKDHVVKLTKLLNHLNRPVTVHVAMTAQQQGGGDYHLPLDYFTGTLGSRYVANTAATEHSTCGNDSWAREALPMSYDPFKTGGAVKTSELAEYIKAFLGKTKGGHAFDQDAINFMSHVVVSNLKDLFASLSRDATFQAVKNALNAHIITLRPRRGR